MAAVTRTPAGPASVNGSTDAAVVAPTPLNETLELFAWAERTRASSQRLRREASELREAAIEIRNRARLPAA